MIQAYVETLVDNVPKPKKPVQIDLILSGGAFNGSYLLGGLYFLRELERRKYVRVRRISSCSVSSILATLYLTNQLDKADELYRHLCQQFRTKCELSCLFQLKDLMSPFLTDEMCRSLHNKLYICYNNCQTLNKKVVHSYRDVSHLCEIITRSCFVPYMIDTTECYNGRYVDGMLPHFFSPTKERMRLYFNVYTLDKLLYAVHIRNENTNYHRILEGMLEVHKFFIKGTNTSMCSNVDMWSLQEHLWHIAYSQLERIAMWILWALRKWNIPFDLLSRWLIQRYCI